MLNCNDKTFCRVIAGEICGFSARTEEKLRTHLYHYSKENIASVPSSYIMPKGSPLEVRSNLGAEFTFDNIKAHLQDLFEGPIMWLQNTGLLDKFFIEVLNAPPQIPLKKIRVNEALNVKQLATAAIVMLFGIVLSSLLFLGELCYGTTEARETQVEKEDYIWRRPPIEPIISIKYY